MELGGRTMERQIICVGKGNLGKAFARQGTTCLGIDDLDITNAGSVNYTLSMINPKCVINCAGVVGNGKADYNPAYTYEANVSGAINLAKFCRNNDVKLIHISTVYAGDHSLYAKTKLISETVVEDICSNYLIVKLPWLFGLDVDNYVLKSLKDETVEVYDDEYGYVAYDRDVVFFILGHLDMIGITAIANEGLLERRELIEFIGGKYSLVSRGLEIPKNIFINNFMRSWNDAVQDFVNGFRSMQSTS